MFLQALMAASGGRMVPAPGGVLIRDAAGAIIGAVGISGDTSDKDEMCCVAGIAAAGLKADTGVNSIALASRSGTSLYFDSFRNIEMTNEQSNAIVRRWARSAQETRLDLFRLLVTRAGQGCRPGHRGDGWGSRPRRCRFICSSCHAGLITQRRLGRQLIYSAEYGAMNGASPTSPRIAAAEGLQRPCCEPACDPADRRLKEKPTMDEHQIKEMVRTVTAASPLREA